MEFATVIFIVVFLVGYFFVKNERLKNFTYDERSGVLTVRKREANNRGSLSYMRIPLLQSQYVPASATYTGVTVGGITTGGVEVTEAHYESRSVGKTDRYYLYFKRSDKHDQHIVSKIELTNEDAAAAKKIKTLSPFLVGNQLVLKHRISDKSSTTFNVAYQSTGNLNVAQNAIAADLANQNLTLIEVKAVIEFLCGEVQKSVGKAVVEKNSIPNNAEESKTSRKHPSKCVFYDSHHNCQCTESKSYQMNCHTTKSCKFYKEK